jgi:uncharacterized protein (DUF2062 family)
MRHYNARSCPRSRAARRPFPRVCGAWRAELAGFVTGILVMVVLLCLTAVFKNMPNAAQGAIIISGVITLFDYKTGIFMWKVRPSGSRPNFLKAAVEHVSSAQGWPCCLSNCHAPLLICSLW